MRNKLCEKAERWKRLAEKIVACDSEADMKRLVANIQGGDGVRILSFLNANAANIAWDNKDFFDWFIASDLILRDGSGVFSLMKMLRHEPGLNLNGTDFIPQILGSYPDKGCIAIYGTEEPYLSIAAEKIKQYGFNHIQLVDGFQDEDIYVSHYLEARPAVVILAMGMPKQNRVAMELKCAAGDIDTLIINGGAIIDFLAGRFKRAPEFIRKSGLEWLYRFAKEPIRLWGRIVHGKPLFLFRSFLVRICSSSAGQGKSDRYN